MPSRWLGDISYLGNTYSVLIINSEVLYKNTRSFPASDPKIPTLDSALHDKVSNTCLAIRNIHSENLVLASPISSLNFITLDHHYYLLGPSRISES